MSATSVSHGASACMVNWINSRKIVIIIHKLFSHTILTYSTHILNSLLKEEKQLMITGHAMQTGMHHFEMNQRPSMQLNAGWLLFFLSYFPVR